MRLTALVGLLAATTTATITAALQVPFTLSGIQEQPRLRFELDRAVHVPLLSSSSSSRSRATAACDFGTNDDAVDKPRVLVRERYVSTRDRLGASMAERGGYDLAQSPALLTRALTRTRGSTPVVAAAGPAAGRRQTQRRTGTGAGAVRGQSEWESGDDGNDQDDDGERVIVPDVSSAATLSLLGKMTSNAYLAPDEHAQWYDLADDGQDGRSWNASASFGWDEDGVRGHVFKSHDDAVVVVAIKGTSASFVAASSGQAVDDDVLGMFGGTAHNDKLNDNLLFSCCCARVDWTWSTVCPCYTGSSYTCTQSCLEQSLAARDAYYSRATAVYDAVARLYPHAQIWLVGHSLGGALAALLAHTYAVPAVAFEAPGDVLPAKRLHVPLPRASSDVSPQQLVTHVYHTADPIAMGVCTGTLSLCGAAGFALESKCHTGQLVVFDTVDKLGWAVDLRTHRINAVIEHLLRDDWEDPQPQQPPDSTATASIAASTASSVDKRAIERTALRLWGWWPGGGGGGSDDEKGGGGGDDKDKKKRKGGMPPAKLEDPDCVDCFRWEYI